MEEDRKPTGDSQEPIDHQSQDDEFREQNNSGIKMALVLLVLVALIAGGYGWLQHNSAQQLASDRANLKSSLDQAKSQEDALLAKVNALNVAQAQADAARAQTEAAKNEQFPPVSAEAPKPHVVHRTAKVVSRQPPPDDPRWKLMQDQLADQQRQLADDQKQISDTQANLAQARSDLEGNIQSTRTDLSGDIARSHDELVALEKKGERTYYEFNFEKSKTYHHSGPISISVRRLDPKHGNCDLEMLVDDREIERKHVNLYEAVTFYPQGYPLPLEVVINHIDKNSAQGYVSEPKYKPTEQATTATPATVATTNPPAAVPAAPAAADPKLEHRTDEVH
jgi:multidrug efflux pump subunit AcrA (membrane-fusion protein)